MTRKCVRKILTIFSIIFVILLDISAIHHNILNIQEKQ